MRSLRRQNVIALGVQVAIIAGPQQHCIRSNFSEDSDARAFTDLSLWPTHLFASWQRARRFNCIKCLTVLATGVDLLVDSYNYYRHKLI